MKHEVITTDGAVDLNLIDAHVGGRLRMLRKERGLSQTDIGQAIGVSFQQVQKYERGTNRLSASALFTFARFLNVEPGHFFDGLPGSDGALPTESVTALAELAATSHGLECMRNVAMLEPRQQKLLAEVARDMNFEVV